jgi:hypothetical protein
VGCKVDFITTHVSHKQRGGKRREEEGRGRGGEKRERVETLKSVKAAK